MQHAQPTQAHAFLAKLEGSWQGNETIHPAPWDPNPTPAVGHITNRLALNNLIVVHDYTQQKNNQTAFEGHAVFSYDTNEQKYKIHWFDLSGQPPCLFTGDVQNNILTATSPGVPGHTKVIYDLSNPTQIQFTMHHSPDGQTWSPFIEATYIRSS